MGILVELSSCVADAIIAGLRNMAPDIPVWRANEDPPADEVETILAWSLRPGMISSYANLKFVNGAAAGVEQLLATPDLPAHMPVTRVVDLNKQTSIAHFVLAQTLRHARGPETQGNGERKRRISREMSHCRVGVLGLGEIGSIVARTFAAIDYSVSGWSRSHKEIPGVNSYTGTQGLHAMLAVSNILVCTLPLSPQTQGILNRERLSMLPKGAYIINVGRDEHLVESDLVAMIDAGHLAGAVLNVFSKESPQPGDPVWNHPRIKAVPYAAGDPSYELLVQQCIDNVRRARAGRPLLHVVDREVGY